ncbi:hypothetical protein [Viridibacillus arvi]|uniref:hypothetical protein n=1 Tax=Viridibacillus arvi TaxID=263475 RepID=UPI003CFF2CCB
MSETKIDKEFKAKQDYLQFHVMNVAPIMDKLLAAKTKEERAKFQMEIVSVIENAGHQKEANDMKAMFNL